MNLYKKMLMIVFISLTSNTVFAAECEGLDDDGALCVWLRNKTDEPITVHSYGPYSEDADLNDDYYTANFPLVIAPGKSKALANIDDQGWGAFNYDTVKFRARLTLTKNGKKVTTYGAYVKADLDAGIVGDFEYGTLNSAWVDTSVSAIEDYGKSGRYKTKFNERTNLEAYFTYLDADWISEALSRQYRLQKHTPIVQGIIAGTHNSYSSNAYNLKLYENQNLSISEQLNAGVRFIELDMWRTRNVEYAGIYLCHNGGRCEISLNGDYIYLDTALREIAKWTKNNPDQILIIKVENGNMSDDDFNILQQNISVQIGDIVYRPEGDATSCKKFPAQLTPADMLKQGKQVLFYGYVGCDSIESGSNSWIFDASNSEIDENFTNYTNCSSHQESSFMLFYESKEEIVGKKSGAKISPEVIPDLSSCGGTFYGFDWLDDDDERMEATVWSWGRGQPSGEGTCAVSEKGRFYASDCNSNLPYACSSQAGEWKLTTGSGPFSYGDLACPNEFGTDFTFDVPRTAKQNKKLIQLTGFEKKYWLNYQSEQSDVWLSGQDRSLLTSEQTNTGKLRVKAVVDYDFVYADTGTDTGLNLGIYKAKRPNGWFYLGYTPAFAADGPHASSYSRTPGRTIIVKDDGTDKLVDPVRYEWLWNDWKTGGDQDVTFWRPVAPQGYTCIGDVVRLSHDRNQPNFPIKCVRNDLLTEAASNFYWNDSGSGGAYKGVAYLSVPYSNKDVNKSISPNTIRLGPNGANKVLKRDKIQFED